MRALQQPVTVGHARLGSIAVLTEEKDSSCPSGFGSARVHAAVKLAPAAATDVLQYASGHRGQQSSRYEQGVGLTSLAVSEHHGRKGLVSPL